MKRNRLRLGDISDQQKRVRPQQKRLEPAESWEGREDTGVYNAIIRVLREMGFLEEAFWYLTRNPADAEFRKEGRYVIAPGTWDQLTITAPPRGAILLTSIKFFYPERIGRRNTTTTLRWKDQTHMLGFQTTQQSPGAPPAPSTIFDTILHNRFLIRNGETVSFRIQNNHLAARAIVDFEIIGRRGYLSQELR